MRLVRNAVVVYASLTVLLVLAAEALSRVLVPLLALLVVASLLKWLLEP